MNFQRNSAAIGVTTKRLAQYKAVIDAEISSYSSQLSEEWGRKYTPYSRDALNAYLSILGRGGKRLRGAMVMNAYEMLGGQDEHLAISAARIIEMIHAYLLIIDDIADNSDMRRNGLTAHRLLEAYHRDNRLHGDSEHFGVAMAMHAALAGNHLALSDLGELPLLDTIKLEAMNSLNQALLITINGQFNDIFHEVLQDVSEAQVKDVLIWKTAYYSFLNPLEFGGIIAGVGPNELVHLRNYAVPAGLSFQLIDDILGTFGDSDVSGKSATDDLREGKITLLVAHAIAHADPDQKRRILTTLGNRNLSDEEFAECRSIIADTGALEYTRQLAKDSAARAADTLDNAPSGWRAANVDFLRGLTAYITSRTS